MKVYPSAQGLKAPGYLFDRNGIVGRGVRKESAIAEDFSFDV
jgi:hypothetical protein